MTQRERMLIGALFVLLAVGGGVVWSVALRPPLVVDASSLDGLPEQIGMWRALGDVPVDGEVEAMLRADFNLQRLYWHPVGGAIALYVGYYGTERGGRPEHTPQVCYPSSGWSILAHRNVSVDPQRGLRANEFEVQRDEELRLIHFYYRNYRTTGMLGGLDQILDRLVSRLVDNRSDGALVRVATPLEAGSQFEARSRLVAFTAELDPMLDHIWPTETPAGP